MRVYVSFTDFKAYKEARRLKMPYREYLRGIWTKPKMRDVFGKKKEKSNDRP